MVYLLVGSAILLGIIYEKTKGVTWYQLSLIWILLGWSYGNPDYHNYLIRYKYYDSSALAAKTEWLFTKIFAFGNKMKLEYQEFLPILALIYVVVLGIIVVKLSATPNLVLSLYLIFPACIEATQIRFVMANIFIYLGFLVLFKSESKFAEIQYVICVIIASLLHIGMLVFLTMLPIRYFNVRKTIFYSITLVVGILVMGLSGIGKIVGYFPGMNNKFSLIAGNGDFYRIKYWGIRVFILWTLFFIIIFLFKDFYKKNCTGKIYFDYTLKIAIISFVVIPLLTISVDTYRIQQSLCLIYYCCFSWFFKKGIVIIKNRKKCLVSKNGMIFLLCCVVFSSLYLYVIVLSSSNFITVFLPYFENNLIFERFF